ncbi:hypothetical protein [Paraglaciecola sp. MB-3u-78]|uniref:hypothetical protein n=1 Tax=Paraglaciecola sp. MB-3u-78 TaxID=2058332 RepID=UPI000C34E736|nr:hypothetical protein [Paraglaciecola sp. MB-3u-78]PKG99076.1 hypothetical protein CXF95_07180 [Paraglaciecola sp. MB-3u-78]
MSHDNEEEYDWAEDEYSMEESTILDLVNNKLVKSNYFNSFEWSRNCFERIKNNQTSPLITSEYLFENNLTPSFTSNLNDLNNYKSLGFDELDLLESKYSKIGVRNYQTDKSNYIIDNPVELFMDELIYGEFPAPETLLSLYKCFNLYFLSKGTLTLEEVFFGKPIKRAGSYAKRKFSKQVYSEFHWCVMREIQEPSFDLKDFSIRYLANASEEENPSLRYFHEGNINSFLKGYDRWKSNISKDNKLKKTIDVRLSTQYCLIGLGYETEQVKNLIVEHFDAKASIESNLISILQQIVTDK